MRVAVHDVDQHIKGVLPHGTALGQGSENQKFLDQYYKDEWKYNKGDKAKPPQQCIAFSGGGIRSAAFSIGVMKGLHAIDAGNGENFLDKIDVMSGVSGGAYALSWYYMNQLDDGADSKHRIFEPEAQQYLREHADFMALWRYAPIVVGYVPLFAYNIVFNGVWGWHANSSFLATSLYEGAIRRTFHGGRAATFTDLNSVVVSKKLPFFVINTTARIDEDSFHHDSLLSRTVFEFTPLRFGSETFGYSDKFPLDVAETVEVSGAALDTPHNFSGTSQKAWGQLLNFDTGRYITNVLARGERSWWERLIFRASPFPFYFFQRAYLRDKYGERIYLSDGGHSENLGAYSLIRRGCSHILIVDAEYDPGYTFESYIKMKEAVGREMHASVELKKENGHDVENILSRLDARATLGNYDDNHNTPVPHTFNLAKPVMNGEVKEFPLTNGEAVALEKLALIYVKMALDTTELDKWDTLLHQARSNLYSVLGESVISYYLSAKNQTCKMRPWLANVRLDRLRFRDCAFPQYPTTYQSYSAEQFAAYVQLGEKTVLNHLQYDQSSGALKIQ